MGMSTYVLAFREEDETYKKMEAAWHACVAAGVDLPVEVEGYFQGSDPKYGYGKIITLPLGIVLEEQDSESCQQFIEVDLTQLPQGVTKLRFVNSY